MSVNTKQAMRVGLIKWAVTILIPLMIWLIPTNELFTAQIRIFIVITIFGILLCVFEAFNELLISLIFLFGYVLSGCATMTTAFSAFGLTMTWMIVGVFFLSNALNESGLLRRVVFWCLIRTGANFRSLLLGYFAAGVLVTILTFGNAGPVIATIGLGICLALDMPKGSKSAAAIILVAFWSTAETRACLYSPVFIAILNPIGRELIAPDYAISWLDMTWFNVTNWVIIAIMMVITIKMFKPDHELQGVDYFKNEYDKLGKMGLKEKVALLDSIAIMIFILTNPWHGIDNNWAFIILPWIMCLPGIKVASDDAIKNIPWHIIVFVIACYSIGTVASGLGIGTIIADIALPHLHGVGIYMSTFILYILTIILNFVMTPYAIMSAIGGPFTLMAIDMGIDPMAWHMAMLFGSQQLIFPYENTIYLILFAFGLIEMKDFVKVFSIKMVIGIIVFAALTIPSWFLMGLL